MKKTTNRDESRTWCESMAKKIQENEYDRETDGQTDRMTTRQSANL